VYAVHRVRRFADHVRSGGIAPQALRSVGSALLEVVGIIERLLKI
jgi:hypothetical protein